MSTHLRPAPIAFVVLAALTSGCAHLWPPWPFNDSKEWEIARTTRFVAYTASGQPAATLENLERSYAILESTLFKTKPVTPVEVLLLDWPDLRRELGTHRTGAAMAELPGKGFYARRGLMVIYAEDATSAGAVHRLTHVMLHAVAPKAPLWLHEGLATYLEPLDFHDDEKEPTACLGQLPKKDAMMPLPELQGWSWGEFDESGKWSSYRYTAASLIDFFMTADSGKMREKLTDLIAQLGEGAGFEAALKKVYPALSFATLAEQVRDHRDASELAGRGRCPVVYPVKAEVFADSAKPALEEAAEEDVASLLLRLRMLPRRDGRVDWYPPEMIGVEGGQFPARKR